MTDNTFYQDLLAAQKEIEGVEKSGENPFFKSDYTTLNDTIVSCKETLNKHNIVVLQPINSDPEGVYVCTTLIHTSGETLTSKMRIVPSKDNDPQSQGSAITYARRYALKSMLCMSDADDDGEKAMARPKTVAPISPTVPKVAPGRVLNNTGAMCPDCHAPAGWVHSTTCKAIMSTDVH